MVGDTTSLEHASAQQRALEDDALPVGEVARMAGVTVRTLHHYDEIGLVRPGRRTRSGYRLYDENAATTVRQVRGLLEAGLSTNEFRLLLPCATRSTPELEPCSEVLDLLRARMSGLDDRIDCLRRSATRSGGTCRRPSQPQPRPHEAWRRPSGPLLGGGSTITGGAVPGTRRHEADQRPLGDRLWDTGCGLR